MTQQTFPPMSCPKCGNINSYDFQVNFISDDGFYLVTCLHCGSHFCGGFFPEKLRPLIERLLGNKLIELCKSKPIGVV